MLRGRDEAANSHAVWSWRAVILGFRAPSVRFVQATNGVVAGGRCCLVLEVDIGFVLDQKLDDLDPTMQSKAMWNQESELLKFHAVDWHSSAPWRRSV